MGWILLPCLLGLYDTYSKNIEKKSILTFCMNRIKLKVSNTIFTAKTLNFKEYVPKSIEAEILTYLGFHGLHRIKNMTFWLRKLDSYSIFFVNLYWEILLWYSFGVYDTYLVAKKLKKITLGFLHESHYTKN